MNRIAQLDPIQATEKTKQLFERLQMKFGFVPNLFSILAVSPRRGAEAPARNGFRAPRRTRRFWLHQPLKPTLKLPFIPPGIPLVEGIEKSVVQRGIIRVIGRKDLCRCRS